ncbi:Methylated-DNA--protein-cysteine methyltransferase [hydrothermal vent metagenome]|uniref:methylated-DNA--[protein]-cysteine S-methyltransferase n=1 Tax=hydrothermal vent metagenome TaxID=652676 RepID=A0A3B0Y2H7_9ZZZZ
MESATITSPVGLLKLTVDHTSLLTLDFTTKKSSARTTLSETMNQVCAQLEAYFENSSWTFNLNLNFMGTSHQQKVWRALQKIKPGKTLSYGVLAKRVNSAAQAIGGACKANPTPIIVPCHRVVAVASSGGFCGHTSGPAMDIKHWLLEHEAHA